MQKTYVLHGLSAGIRHSLCIRTHHAHNAILDLTVFRPSHTPTPILHGLMFVDIARRIYMKPRITRTCMNFFGLTFDFVCVNCDLFLAARTTRTECMWGYVCVFLFRFKSSLLEHVFNHWLTTVDRYWSLIWIARRYTRKRYFGRRIKGKKQSGRHRCRTLDWMKKETMATRIRVWKRWRSIELYMEKLVPKAVFGQRT